MRDHAGAAHVSAVGARDLYQARIDRQRREAVLLAIPVDQPHEARSASSAEVTGAASSASISTAMRSGGSSPHQTGKLAMTLGPIDASLVAPFTDPEVFASVCWPRMQAAAGTWVLLASFALACSIEPNYTNPDGPRCYGDYAAGEPELGDVLRAVSYNLEFGREVETAIAALETEPLAGADVILMQEMEAGGVEAIAAALGLRYVYYPASVKHGRDWGNAVLSPWPMRDYRKVLLPWADPYTNSRRIAVTATLEIGGVDLAVYSTHTATPSLGLGARLDQIEAILDDAGDSAPVAIGGDLNTADPGSGGQVRELFGDRGFDWASDGATDTGSAFGSDATLDYVFTRGLTPRRSGTFAGDSGSDHQPIWVELEPPP